MEIALNPRLTSTQLTKLQFVAMEPEAFFEEEPGFKEFLANPAMNGDATEEEIEFLRGLRFKHNRPSTLYYHCEVQRLRDPLHFPEHAVAVIHKRRDADDVRKQMQLDSRKRAIRRWAGNKSKPRKSAKS